MLKGPVLSLSTGNKKNTICDSRWKIVLSVVQCHDGGVYIKFPEQFGCYNHCSSSICVLPLSLSISRFLLF